MSTSTALVTNDAVVLGLLASVLGLVFYTSSHKSPALRRFYAYVPALLLCYFIPSLFNTFGIIDGEHSALYPIASRYLLPMSLVLFTLSIDYKAIASLGPKAITLFLTGTAGVMIGGPLSLFLVGQFAPETLGGDHANAAWRGLATLAGSWIGGGANQTALKEVFTTGGDIFSVVVTVDVIVANLWMAFLLWLASRAQERDAKIGADTRAIEALKEKMARYEAENARIPTLADLVLIVSIGLGVTGLAHFAADLIAPWLEANYPALARYSLTSKFFWLVAIATAAGMLLSLTRLRHLEAAGASKLGSLALYLLIATIGMQMNITAIAKYPVMFLVGALWILIHGALILGVARLIKAPTFFIGVGSMANIGAAASAPVVAAAFHPALAPVGVLLAVLGYALGTYAGYLTGLALRVVAP